MGKVWHCVGKPRWKSGIKVTMVANSEGFIVSIRKVQEELGVIRPEVGNLQTETYVYISTELRSANDVGLFFLNVSFEKIQVEIENSYFSVLFGRESLVLSHKIY